MKICGGWRTDRSLLREEDVQTGDLASVERFSLKRRNRNLKDMTMPKLQAARVTQCGLDFAVVLVDPKLFMNPSELEAFSERAQALFPGVPVAMLSYDDLKVTRYHDPDDVVAFLKQVRVVSLPWVEYTIGE